MAPSTCGQLQIVRYFWDFFSPKGCEAYFAALENKPVNPWLSTAMRDYQYGLSQQQVQSVFMLSTTATEFDCIVSLNGDQNKHTRSPFTQTLDILFGNDQKRIYWDIPDPENGRGDKTELISFAEDIRDRIEFEVAQLAQILEENEL